MIALIKTFTLQPSAVRSEQFHGTSSTSSISSSFAVKIDRLPDSPPPGGNKVAGSFAVRIYRLPDSLRGNRVADSFALAYGGYELDGVILDKELEKTKLIRQK